MKYLILLFPLIAYSKQCPKNIDSFLSTCKDLKCTRDDSKTLNMVFSVKEKFITDISITSQGDKCEMKYVSEWTGTQTCLFPKKYLSKMSSIMGDSSSTETLSMFVAMMKLAKAKTRKDFEGAQNHLNAFQNKMMAKQVEVKKFMDENPDIAGKINSFCKLDESTGNAKKVAQYKGYMNRMSESMAKIQQKIQKKMQEFSK